MMTTGTSTTQQRRFVEPKHAESLIFDWGSIQFLSEPRLTGAQHMSSAIVTLDPGKGHDRHNHPNEEEILYVLEGRGTQTVEGETEERREVVPGTMIHLPAGTFHSTLNTGTEPMKILVVYSPTGPEAFLRSLPGCRIEPAVAPEAA